MKNGMALLTALVVSALALVSPGCDMTHINPDFSAAPSLSSGMEGGISQEEAQALEREGHYLKLLNMPLHTQSPNVKSAGVFNSRELVAKTSGGTGAVQIYRSGGTATVYINLLYLNGLAFTEDGIFYISLSVYIDALTWINVTRESGVLVYFTEGRGTLDVLSLSSEEGTISPTFPDPPPGGGGGNGIGGGNGGGSGGGNGSGPTLEEQVNELEQNGHYLMLYHLPSGTVRSSISGLSVSDGTRSVAYPDSAASALLAPDSVYVNAYIPLASSEGGPFTRTGSFFVSFSVHIDAFTKIIVSRNDNVTVAFTDGRGTLDIAVLARDRPDVIESVIDTESEQDIQDITSQGGYIRFYKLPRNVSKNSFSNISISNASGVISRPGDYQAIAVRKNILDAEAFVPVVSSRDGGTFYESGQFYVAFSVVVDAVTRIIVQPSYAILYPFQDGTADVDASSAPQAPSKPPLVPHCLSIGGLPQVTGAANILDVTVYNDAGIVAKCPDYTKIFMTPHNGKQTAIVPLVYDNNRAFNGMEFADSGNFIVSFSVYPEAGQMIQVTLENNCLVYFTEGNAFLDVSNVPPVPRNCLTITNLPANFQELNVTNVFVWNQAGKVAKCQSYSLLEITRESSTRVMIPLVYNENDSRIFSETGPYYVSFDMNIDALTRIVIAEADRVLVSFTDGKGTLDASTLPQALPVPYFTIMGLPRNTARGNFSEVFLYNAAGKIAKCAGYQGIILSRNNESAAAMIPLVYHEAALQFSAFYSNKQINRLIESLYDRDIIYVSHTGYGLIITALKEGDCAMQTLTESGIKDIAVIHVIE